MNPNRVWLESLEAIVTFHKGRFNLLKNYYSHKEVLKALRMLDAEIQENSKNDNTL